MFGIFVLIFNVWNTISSFLICPFLFNQNSGIILHIKLSSSETNKQTKKQLTNLNFRSEAERCVNIRNIFIFSCQRPGTFITSPLSG